MWAEWFPKHLWHLEETVPISGIISKERLSYREAMSKVQEQASLFTNGMMWGKYWEYGWFATEWTVPARLDGQSLIFVPGVGQEMLIWVNGEERGAVDKKHAYITLCRKAKAGETFHIVMECYAGHGPRMEGGCFCRKDEKAFVLEDIPQQAVKDSYIAIWQEDIFQVGMDYLTLYSLVKRLPDRSLRAIKVMEGLKRFTTKADVEVAYERLAKVLMEADLELKPLLACVNGSTAPEFAVFGQSHLDLAWLWTLEETRRKAARTYSNQLALMEEYPEYHFLLCEPPILEYLKESYPNVWERVKKKVKEGQIYVDGAVYVESDVNMPCGESLVRQFLYGKEWFQKEFQVDSNVAWLPDTFGFPASLPQIMKKCQVPYFSTQKLLRQDPECEPFPYNTFWWQGLDGSRVLSHIYKENNAVPLPEKMIERWENDRIQEEEIDTMMFPFGYGDGGGGATREELELVRRCADLEGAPKTIYESPEAFFKRLEKTGTSNVFTGELYLSWHRGTYTSQARTKLGVRKVECVLKEAEYWHTVCTIWLGDKAGKRTDMLTKLWKRLLVQEFHDILPGTGIAKVHEEAVAELANIQDEAQEVLQECLKLLEEESNVLDTKKTGKGKTKLVYHDSSSCYSLESDYLYMELDSAGRIWRIKNKENGRIFSDEKSPMNEFRLYRNVNAYYDAWEIGRMYEQEEESIDRTEWKISKAVYEGQEAWLLQGKIADSPFSQYILMGEDGRQIEFYTQIDWQENHRMLKVDFPFAIHSQQVMGEVAFGVCSYPTTRSWRWEKDRYEVCRHRYCVLENGREGAAVLNDSKYGWSAKENQMSLTLLRASVMPDRDADRGLQKFAYACRPYIGSFQTEEIPKHAVDFNRRAHIAEGFLKREKILAQKYSLFTVYSEEMEEKCHVMTEAVKLAEDGSRKGVIRLYEATGSPQRVWLTFPYEVQQVEETNMLEKQGKELVAEDGKYLLEFSTFEIKTLVFVPKDNIRKG